MNNLWVKQLAIFSDKKGLSLTILLVISLTVVGWISVSKFVAIYDRHTSHQTIMELEQEISRLQAQYHSAHPEDLQADLKKAEGNLIQNFTHLTQWAQILQEEGDHLALRMQYQILKGKQTPSSIRGITLVPMELQLRPTGNNSGYESFLQFLKTLDQSGPRVNIHETTIRGDGKKATNFSIGLSTWMKTHDSVEL